VSRSIYALALLAVLAALAIAGCGSSDSSNSGGGGAYGGGGGSTSGGEGSTSASSESSEGGGGSYSYSAPANGEAEESGAAYVALGSVPKLGMVLVDSKGFVLYDFHKDKGTTSSCYGECAAVWPPLLSKGAPQPSNGASASQLGTTERKDGTTQVTYAGHPLYTYVADKKPGEANGNDFSSFGAQWYALKGSGEEAGD
jgi:predicted lipoprotein with Yx(FWY)xxD motif